MVDFAKLAKMTPEERAATREQVTLDLKAARKAELRAKIKHTRVLTTIPSDEIDCRYEARPPFSKSMYFSATDDRGRTERCSRLFDEDQSDEADAFMLALAEKPMKFTARGYFRPWTNVKTSKVHFSFVIVEIEA